MKSKTLWTPSDLTNATALRPIEFKGNDNSWYHFELCFTPDRIVFGGCCNTGFLESGYILREDHESLDETLQELIEDLEVFYDDGHAYPSRLVHNERM